MGEDEVATKAPESNAQEPSAVSAGDTSAQHGASMGVSHPKHFAMTLLRGGLGALRDRPTLS